MNPEELELLKKTARLAEENNVILHKMQRSSRWGLVIKVSYWILIILLSIGAFYGFQAYIGSLKGDFSIADGTSGSSSLGTSTSTGPGGSINSLLQGLGL